MLGVSQSRGLKLFGRELIFQEFQPMCCWYLNVMDRQTDRRLTVALPRSALASSGKNCTGQLAQETSMSDIVCCESFSCLYCMVLYKMFFIFWMTRQESVNGSALYSPDAGFNVKTCKACFITMFFVDVLCIVPVVSLMKVCIMYCICCNCREILYGCDMLSAIQRFCHVW